MQKTLTVFRLHGLFLLLAVLDFLNSFRLWVLAASTAKDGLNSESVVNVLFALSTLSSATIFALQYHSFCRSSRHFTDACRWYEHHFGFQSFDVRHLNKVLKYSLVGQYHSNYSVELRVRPRVP
jgi:hypothetical protein